MFYSSPQARVLFIATGQGGERERGRQQGGGRQRAARDGGSVQRSWGSAGRARSEAARVAARPGKEAAGAARPARAQARPARSPAAAAASPRSGRWPGAHCPRVPGAGLPTRTAAGPRHRSGRAGSCELGAPGTRVGTCARAGAPVRAARGWALRGRGWERRAGSRFAFFLPASGALWAGATLRQQLGAAFERLEAGAAPDSGRVPGVREPRPRPARPGEPGWVGVCRRIRGESGAQAVGQASWDRRGRAQGPYPREEQ